MAYNLQKYWYCKKRKAEVRFQLKKNKVPWQLNAICYPIILKMTLEHYWGDWQNLNINYMVDNSIVPII